MNLATIRFLIPLMLIFVMTSCAQKEVNWIGTYKSVLPCVNCKGLEATVTLKEDTTFLLQINPLGLDVIIPDTTGRLIWTESNKFFTLDIESMISKHFEVAGDTLFNLDFYEKRVTGPDAHMFAFRKQ